LNLYFWAIQGFPDIRIVNMRHYIDASAFT